MFLTSCNNSKSDSAEQEITTTEVSPNSPLTAKVDGVLLEAFELASYASKLSTPSFTKLTLMGTSVEGEGITVDIGNYKGTGKYNLGMAIVNADNPIPSTGIYVKTNIEDPANTETWFADEGEIEITAEENGKVMGIFSFTTKKGNKQGDKKNITEGVFDLNVK
jgi:hypothetical protein